MIESDFIAAILRNPVNRTILDRLDGLGLPDAWLTSGALFQTFWNVRNGQPPEHGIKDYDIFYFDADTSWDAEDLAIQSARIAFSDVRAAIEVRNQGRVHIWYQEKFGRPYPPLKRATDGIDRFLMPAAQVGMRRNAHGYDLYAPRGLADIRDMIIRPNRSPNFDPDRYMEKALRWKELWPALTVLPA